MKRLAVITIDHMALLPDAIKVAKVWTGIGYDVEVRQELRLADNTTFNEEPKENTPETPREKTARKGKAK